MPFTHLNKGRGLLMQMYFYKGYDYGEKVDLTKGYWNPKRKMHVANSLQSNHYSKKTLKYKKYMAISSSKFKLNCL